MRWSRAPSCAALWPSRPAGFCRGGTCRLRGPRAQAVVSRRERGVVHVLADVVESTAADRGLVPFDALLLSIWAAGVAVSVAVLIAALVRLRHVSTRAQTVTAGPWRWTADALARELGIRRPVVLLQTDIPGFLATWGLQRPRIGLPHGAADWPEARIRAVLHHELAHIRRRDWIVQLVAQFVCAAQWFNPLCWIAGRRLRQLSEMACDDAALRCGMAADEVRHTLAGDHEILPATVGAADGRADGSRVNLREENCRHAESFRRSPAGHPR